MRPIDVLMKSVINLLVGGFKAEAIILFVLSPVLLQGRKTWLLVILVHTATCIVTVVVIVGLLRQGPLTTPRAVVVHGR